MAIELYAGTLADFNDSMALAMETEYAALAGPLSDAPDEIRARRIMFIAIARGVIKHLQAKQDAFAIGFTVAGSTINTHPNIAVRNV
jgi:hypothetical protein